MKTFCAGSLLLFGGVEASPSNLKVRFDAFKQKYHKRYGTRDEEMQRFGNYVENLEKAKIRNNTPGNELAQYGETKFSDWSATEFMEYNALRVSKKELLEHREKVKEQGNDKVKINPVTLPSSFDWRDKGAVNKVKDQKQCGSCWAFGTVASIEGNKFVKDGSLHNLSEQELVSCDNIDFGCNGGLPSQAYTWMVNNGQGLESEADYGYDAVDESCRLEKSKEQVFINGYHAISQHEDAIAAALMKYGPLAVALDATPLMSYNGGIVSGTCDGQIDHAVTLVGFGEENGTKYWIVRNSWGAWWGEEGYFRIARGVGQCSINQVVTAADAKSSSTSETLLV